MVDKVKALKFEDSVSGTEVDSYPTEVDPVEDYLAARGIAVSNSDNHLVHSADNEIAFEDPINGQKKVSDLLKDEKAKVSSNDTTAGYLNGKLVAGTSITLVENNDGGNETLTINATGTSTDEKSKVSSNDTTAGYLNGKLVAGTSITLVENNDGGNETLTINATGAAANDQVKVSSNDTTAGYLNGKLVAGTGIQLTENNNGGNETLTIGSVRTLDSLSDVPTKPVTNSYFLEDINGTLTWTSISGNKDLIIPFRDQYYPYTSMKGTTWEVKTTIIFRGTNVLGTLIGSVKFVLSVQSGGTVEARLFNPVTGLVIADGSTTATTPTIVTDTTVTNLPATESILEIQMRTNSSSDQGYLYSMLLAY